MKNPTIVKPPGSVLIRAILIVSCLLAGGSLSRAAVLISCPGEPAGDLYDRGFYIPYYPGRTLEAVRMEISSSVAGNHKIALTVRKKSYDGPILGTDTVSIFLNGSTEENRAVLFSFPSIAIATGSRVCFALSLVSVPAGAEVYYSVPDRTNGCTEVIQTEGTTPPLDSFRRNGVNLVITGRNNLVVESGGRIQPAIDAASPGETVLVEPGTYNEDIVLRSDVNVMGAGFNSTILQGTGTNNVVTANSVTNSRLEGLKITHSSTNHIYAGVLINGGSLLLNNNWIIGNINGVRVQGGAGAIVRNNIIEDNGVASDAALDYGIVCLSSTPLIANNLVISNHGAGIYFAWAASSGAQAINNTIVGNDQNGIWCYSDANAIIKNNILTGNSVGILATHGTTTPLISFNDVWDNDWRDYDAQAGGVAGPGLGDISADPLFDPAASLRFALSADSPCINAGDPDPVYNDLDGSRSDMGAYGGPSSILPGLVSPVTSGFIFNNIGKIPTSEISRTGDLAGLANVSSTVANDLKIYQYKDAPFGGWLWVHGLFGSSDTSVQYYRILAAKWNGASPPAPADFQPVLDPLSKIKYTVTSTGKVLATSVSIGPDANGLYLRTDSGYWAFPDLKLIWNTRRLENGRYDLICQAYSSSNLASEVPLPTNELSSITLYVDNTPVTVAIQSVRDQSGSLIPECGLISLATAQDPIQFEIQAYHPNGFLRNYTLSALYGRNHNGGVVAADQYVGSHDGTRPFWNGPNPVMSNSLPAHISGALAPWTTCTYQFHLEAWARTTDGFNHIYYQVFNDHYFLGLGPVATSCPGDFDNDGDVDGADLATFAAQFGRTNCVLPAAKP
ncbi:MAG: right-handed parallel beta-helix repeat-containing protein [Candidatus Omnitrophica bacterium]|nr:right-handed parallel beta-helix repeat-containing protein [Candidatus Omnitrophota bacterium]